MNIDLYSEINAERAYQDSKWGTDFDDENTANDWASYIVRYTARACEFNNTPDQFRTAMLKVASLAIAAIETVDRNHSLPKRHYD
jgi:hypothetical protein